MDFHRNSFVLLSVVLLLFPRELFVQLAVLVYKELSFVILWNAAEEVLGLHLLGLAMLMDLLDQVVPTYAAEEVLGLHLLALAMLMDRLDLAPQLLFEV